jgi:hypothetical protein
METPDQVPRHNDCTVNEIMRWTLLASVIKTMFFNKHFHRIGHMISKGERRMKVTEREISHDSNAVSNYYGHVC